MNKKFVALLAVAVVLLAIGGGYLYLYKDMTGAEYSEIQAYRERYPHKTITYTVTIEGGESPLKLKEDSSYVELTHDAQIDSLIDQAEYLQRITEINMGDLVCSRALLNRLQEAFPHAFVRYRQIEIFGKAYPQNTPFVDLTGVNAENLENTIADLALLVAPEHLELGDNIDLEVAYALYQLYPDIKYDFSVELFGQTLSTDMETVEYFKVPIYDEGLIEFRKLLPMMYNLTYFKLDWCETTDEAMAQLREDFAPQGIKVVWRVFFARMNALTDTYKIWASWSMNDYITEPLKYCNEVKYLDLGHAFYTNIEFVKYMPNLEVCILSDSDFVDLTPIKYCKKLTFLEMLSCYVKDLSPIAELENLEYLNISNLPIKSIEPLYELPNLKRVWCTMVRLPQDQVDTFTELHPDCETVFNVSGDPTDYGWRYVYQEGVGRVKHPRYALLTEQFGYERWDYSQYPKGYVREEITYESTGITPD